MISVSALSSYIHCPRQFFVHYVLKEALPPKDVIVLGSIKHKVYEMIADREKDIICSLLPGSDVHSVLRTCFVKFLRDAVRASSNRLRTVQLPLVDAFRLCLPAVEFEVKSRVAPVSALLDAGLYGEDLYAELSPKVKSEYSVKALELSGRVDRLECHPDRVIPVELKSGKPPDEGVWDTHRMQVACYMLMLAEHFGTAVNKAVVHYIDADMKREVTMNPFLEEWVHSTRDACMALLESKTPPKGCGRETCEYCKRNL
ncbi:PD-(D/E)XK nuclease family protein [Candidatus Woesearchaeota archaeon]|nr:PD-(D/E)XK nuclease family protein [Candidatus Woesearchaeota archaeon]